MNKTLLAMAIVLVILPAPALASLEIIGFTCNNMAPTANIETGTSMNCEATIQNTDSQNAASMTSATLVTSGGWANAASYTGTGFSGSISAGGTTTAAFSSITATSSGSHAFLHIDIDSSPHTEEVADLTVNAVAFKSLSATPSASSATSGGTFSVSAYLTAGGSVSSASMTLSLSGGCSLASGETASKSLGSMSDSVEVSRTWTVTQGSSTCAVTVSAAGTSSPVSLSLSRSASVLSTGGSTTSGAGGGSGGGGGGGGGATSTTEPAELASAGSSSEIAAGGTLRFLLGGEEHAITVLSLTGTTATIEVSSSPVALTLSLGETARVDLDQDGVLDLAITLEGIDLLANTARLYLKPISESLSLPPGVIPIGGVCPPQERKCAGTDLMVCRTDGLAWETTPCPYSCDPLTLQCQDEPSLPAEQEPPLDLTTVLIPLAGGLVVALLAAGLLYRRSRGRKLYAIAFLIITSSALVLLLLPSPHTGFTVADFKDTAACLEQSGTILYSASWCGECREQERLLGDYLSHVQAVDCGKNPEACSKDGVKEIPAWRVKGELRQGMLPFSDIRGLSGC